MRCPRCGFESPLTTSYCGGCGSRLTVACAACGAGNPAGFSYCGACGSQLGAPPPATPPAGTAARPAASAPAAERRHLTVMFCDLVGSTSLSALLDPEELRDLIRAYQSTAASVIERYEGYVAQYLGDGILAYFGYPAALEDEARRAVRAGRELVAEIRRLDERLERPAGVSLAARVGIHTGVVVVGEIGGGARREHLALGETPNVAARMQAAAEPDEVVLSAETERLVRGEFRCTSLGSRTIRGLPHPLEVFRAGEEIHAVVAAAPGDAPVRLVGRDAEIEQLEARWTQVLEGAGQVVRVDAEPGMGKSVLVRALAARVAASGGTVLHARCLPYFHTSPLQPVAELLRQWIVPAHGSAEPSPRGALLAALSRHGLEDALPLLASLLGLRHREREAASPTAEPQWRDRTAEAVVELLLRSAAERPTLLFMEDTHWADPSTLELLRDLVDRLQEQPLLLVLTHRPGFQAPWGDPSHQSVLSLGRLSTAAACQLMLGVTGGLSLPDAVATRILERADGVPLFIEELTRSVVESGLLRSGPDGYELVGGDLPPLAIPLTLHDSLEARLERLSSTRELAQLGAALGREFSHDLIAAVADLDEATLAESLDRLVEADLLVRTGHGESATFTFKHALIQDVAYQSMLRSDRQRHHLRIAQVIEERFPDLATQHPELLAQHYTAAGLPERAVELWIRAGSRAVERSANREAITHLRRGLDSLAKQPEAAARRERELELQLTLAPALIATLGHAADEVRNAYAAAHALSEGVADAEQRFEILTGLATTCFVRMEMPEARRAAQEMLRLARAEANPGREAAAAIALGTALLGGGSVEPGLAQLEEGIAGYRPERDFPLAHAAGQDFGVLGMAYSAYALCAVGRPVQGWERIQRAIALARSLGHPHTLALALSFAGSAAYFRRSPELAEAPLRELAELAARERYGHWTAGAAPVEAWMRAATGQGEDALALLLRSGLAAGAAAGRVDIQTVFWRCVAGEVYLLAGRPEDALILLDDVVASIRARPTRLWWLGEAHRLRAGALAALGRGFEADGELARAISESSAAGARLYQLRALLDRADLLSDAGLADRDAGTIAALSASFTEGHDLADLRRARAVLERASLTTRPE